MRLLLVFLVLFLALGAELVGSQLDAGFSDRLRHLKSALSHLEVSQEPHEEPIEPREPEEIADHEHQAELQREPQGPEELIEDFQTLQEAQPELQHELQDPEELPEEHIRAPDRLPWTTAIHPLRSALEYAVARTEQPLPPWLDSPFAVHAQQKDREVAFSPLPRPLLSSLDFERLDPDSDAYYSSTQPSEPTNSSSSSSSLSTASPEEEEEGEEEASCPIPDEQAPPPVRPRKLSTAELLRNLSSSLEECGPQALALADARQLEACCHYRLGLGLLHVWRAQEQEKCESHTQQHRFDVDMSSELGRTSMHCRLRPDCEPGVPENLCTAENIAVNLTRLAEHLSREPHPRVGHEIPRVRLFQSSCAAQLAPATVGNGMDLWLAHAVQGNTSSRASCRAIVEHPVLFLFRWHTNNVYHIHEEFIHTFAASALLDIPVDQLQVVITDRRHKGLLFDFWDNVFSTGLPAIDLPALLNRSAALPAALDPASDLLCFRRAWFNVHSGISIISREKSRMTPCLRSPLIMGMADMVLDGFGIARHPLFTEENFDLGCRHVDEVATALKQHLLTFLQAPHPSSSSSSSSSSSLPKLNWTGPMDLREPLRVTMSVRDESKGRPIPHQSELLAKLGALPFLVDVRAVDFANLGTRDQLRVASETDVLIGVHGAGLVFCLYQPEYGGLVELEHSSRPGDITYPSLALTRGLYVQSVAVSKQDSPALFAAVVDVLCEVRRRRACLVGSESPRV